MKQLDERAQYRITLDADLSDVLELLTNDLPLEPRHRDHALRPNRHCVETTPATLSRNPGTQHNPEKANQRRYQPPLVLPVFEGTLVQVDCGID